MSAFIDLTGQRFGKLTVICENGRKYHSAAVWLCKCDCGREVSVLAGSLRRGASTSCGCAQNKWLSERKIAEKHGGARTTPHGGKERLYRVWCGMKERCYSPKHNRYENYGGRGISVCDEWRDNYSAFREWALAHGYTPEAPRGACTIDRIDVNGDYCPGNCRWVDNKTQCNNKRRPKNV